MHILFLLPPPRARARARASARGHSSAPFILRHDKINRVTFIVAFTSPPLRQDLRRANTTLVEQYHIIIYIDYRRCLIEDAEEHQVVGAILRRRKLYCVLTEQEISDNLRQSATNILTFVANTNKRRYCLFRIFRCMILKCIY